MSNSSLEQDLKTYQDLIAILQERPTPTEAEILNILLARDRIQTALTETYLITDNILNILQELDNILRKKQATIAPIIAQLRPDFNPDTKNWWWLLEVPKIDSSWHKYDLLANGASVTFLTISLGLIGEIGSRFLSGGSDILGGFLISFQSILTLLAAGGVLTKTGQETGKNLLARFGIQEQYWQEIGAGLSFLLMLSIWGLRLSLPTVATWYNHWGWSHYQKGDLSSAEEDYQRALSLNPDDAEAHFNLGLLYEELQDFEALR
jgi:tetratricopeptide (TPR) repeat protein